MHFLYYIVLLLICSETGSTVPERPNTIAHPTGRFLPLQFGFHAYIYIGSLDYKQVPMLTGRFPHLQISSLAHRQVSTIIDRLKTGSTVPERPNTIAHPTGRFLRLQVGFHAYVQVPILTCRFPCYVIMLTGRFPHLQVGSNTCRQVLTLTGMFTILQIGSHAYRQVPTLTGRISYLHVGSHAYQKVPTLTGRFPRPQVGFHTYRQAPTCMKQDLIIKTQNLMSDQLPNRLQINQKKKKKWKKIQSHVLFRTSGFAKIDGPIIFSPMT